MSQQQQQQHPTLSANIFFLSPVFSMSNIRKRILQGLRILSAIRQSSGYLVDHENFALINISWYFINLYPIWLMCEHERVDPHLCVNINISYSRTSSSFVFMNQRNKTNKKISENFLARVSITFCCSYRLKLRN